MRYVRMYTVLVLPIVLFAIISADDSELENDTNSENEPKVTVILQRILSPEKTVKSVNKKKNAANEPKVTVTLQRVLKPYEKQRLAKQAELSQIQIQAKFDEKICNEEIYENPQRIFGVSIDELSKRFNSTKGKATTTAAASAATNSLPKIFPFFRKWLLMLTKPAILKKLTFHKLQFYEESLTIYMRLKRDVNNHPELDISEYHEDFITRLIRDFIRELQPSFISIETMFALYAIKNQKDKAPAVIVKEIAQRFRVTMSVATLMVLKYLTAFAWKYRKEFAKQKTATGMKSLIYQELLWLFFDPQTDVMRQSGNEAKVRVMLAYFVLNSKELFGVDATTKLELML